MSPPDWWMLPHPPPAPVRMRGSVVAAEARREVHIGPLVLTPFWSFSAGVLVFGLIGVIIKAVMERNSDKGPETWVDPLEGSALGQSKRRRGRSRRRGDYKACSSTADGADELGDEERSGVRPLRSSLAERRQRNQLPFETRMGVGQEKQEEAKSTRNGAITGPSLESGLGSVIDNDLSDMDEATVVSSFSCARTGISHGME